jgi:transcription elongation factor Elf1
MEIPELGEATDDIAQQGRNLLPWLPDPLECPKCGAYCYTSTTWDPHMVEYTESWLCKSCNQHYYRDTDGL